MPSVKKKFVLDSRIVWVEISGLPLYAWTCSAFKKVDSLWGNLLFIDEDEESQEGSGRVCIKTTHMDKIPGKVQVQIEDEKFLVSVVEISDWIPTIQACEFEDRHEEEDD